MMASGDHKNAESIYAFSAKDIDGNEVGTVVLYCCYHAESHSNVSIIFCPCVQVSLEKYKGHVCIIVNVASK